MIPENNGQGTFEIPITFDSNTGASLENQKYRGLWALLAIFVWLVFVVVIAIAASGAARWLWMLFITVVDIYVIRFIIFKEHYYRKKWRELQDNEYRFSSSLIWNIYEVPDRYPYFYYYANGYKGLFVLLVKDIVVGKDEDNSFWHRKYIGDARGMALKKGIEFVHIDYMDVVGKDSRLRHLYKVANDSVNEDLRRILTHIYDNVESTMNRSYASYDVYAFMSKEEDGKFYDDVMSILPIFRRANYKGYKFMTGKEVGEVVEAVYGIGNFSVRKASTSLFDEINPTENLRVIWVEKDGEREEHSKTMEEIEEMHRVRREEKGLKQKGSAKGRFKRRRHSEEEEIEIF